MEEESNERPISGGGGGARLDRKREKTRLIKEWRGKERIDFLSF
jgi:hypothetical protein